METTEKRARSWPAWTEPFLAALMAGNTASAAAGIAGVERRIAYHLRKRNADFRAAWLGIRPSAKSGLRVGRPGSQRSAAKLDRFIEGLASTSNVCAAAAEADLAPGAIYRLRRENPEFARRWYAALAEGYDNLEMELLGHLRAGEGGEGMDRRKFDTAAALRCLAAHRESVAREKGRRALAEEVTTIESINAKIDKLRLNAAAGAKAIAEARKENARRKAKGRNDAG